MQVYRQFPKLKLSGPAKIDSRICFGIIFCSSEADAEKLAKRVEARGDTYNGGWQDGKRVGFGTELKLKRSDFNFDKGQIGNIGDEAIIVIDCAGQRD